MSKTLTLIRHAKSSWKFPDLDDHDRPLNKRGNRDKRLMANYLAQQSWPIDIIFSSTAERALSYAKILSEQGLLELSTTSSLYTFRHREVLAFIIQLDESLCDVALVGHNPAMTALVNDLGNQVLDNLPTSALVRIEFSASNWAEIGLQKGRVVESQSPKKLALQAP